MKLIRKPIAIAFAALLLLPLIAQAKETTDRGIVIVEPERRVALLIGNSAYWHTPVLKNAANDADDMAGVLGRKGFEVTLRKDAGHAEMEKAIREFGKSIQHATVGFFFYAGHGLQVNGTNYLVPVDADIEAEDEIRFKAVDANFILSKMESAGNFMNIMVLDACRVNPYAKFRSISQGLAQMDSPRGSLIVYATSPGRVAQDGDGRNGVFTKHFLSKMDIPGLEIREMLSQVRASVEKETEMRQTPWELSSLTGRFYFTPPAAQRQEPGQAQIRAQTPEPVSSASTDSRYAEEKAWKVVENSNNVEDYKDFIASFPESRLASVARFKLRVLERQKEAENETVAANRAQTREDPRTLFQEGRKHLENKSYAEAQQFFLKAAQQHHPESANELAFMLKQGLAGSQDYAKAVYWFRKAAEGGYSPSQNNLGIMYFKGEGVPKDNEEAAKWFRKAAEQGDPDGQFYLANMYRNGYGVPRDMKEARRLCSLAASQGHELAKEALKRTDR